MARIAWALAATLISTAACDNGKHHLHPDGGVHTDAHVDAPPPPWWQPALGTVKDWDIQLAAPFDVSASRAMYDLPLFALVPSATMITYPGGGQVTFPAGALANKVADLHARGAIVICYVDTGAVSTADPDFAQFPAAVVGMSVDGMGGPEKFLDIREASRTMWVDRMWKRFDLAKTIGCDGVDGAYNDVGSYSNTGFTIPGLENISWYTEVAAQLHSRKLSAGLRNGTLTGNLDANAAKFDWMVFERCGEHQDCEESRPVQNQQHSVFAIDYTTTEDGDPQTSDIVCAKQTQGNISEGIQKDDAITSAVRVPCDP